MQYTVLIADDEPLERDALSALVTERAPGTPKVVRAASGAEVCRLAAERPIDIALLDIRMPGMSGLEAADVLREQSPSMGIVFLSAFDYFAYAQHAIRLGALDYLVKPVDDEAVIRVLAGWYQQTEARAAEERAVVERAAEARTPEELRASPGELRAGPDGNPAQFREAIRFVEEELLDDIIAGEHDAERIAHGLALLGIHEPEGVAIVIAPQLEDYPFALETDQQRRTVVQRAVAAVIDEITTAAPIPVLSRAHPRHGYVLALHRHSDVSAPWSAELHARAAVSASTRAGVPVRIAISKPFTALGELSTRLLAARRTLATSVSGGAQSAEPTPHRASGSLAPPSHTPAEEALLAALTTGDEAELRRVAAAVWDRAVEAAGLEGAPPAAERARELLAFLDGSLRIRRGTDVPERSDDQSGAYDLRSPTSREVFVRAVVARAARSRTADPFARDIIRWIDAHYTGVVGLADLARALGLSESHCSREVHRAIGKPFVTLLRERRLAAARALLAETRLPVADVARRSGFQDPQYFSRVFRTATGMAPAQWRRALGV